MSAKNDWMMEGERPEAQAWIDYGNFVIATHGFPDEATDADWEKLIRWADILMNRYNNRILNAAVKDYLDLMSYRSNDADRRAWRAHREKSTA